MLACFEPKDEPFEFPTSDRLVRTLEFVQAEQRLLRHFDALPQLLPRVHDLVQLPIHVVDERLVGARSTRLLLDGRLDLTHVRAHVVVRGMEFRELKTKKNSNKKRKEHTRELAMFRFPFTSRICGVTRVIIERVR